MIDELNKEDDIADAANDQVNTDRSFEALLDYLHRTRGFDFSGYKRSSLMRRIDKRIQSVGGLNYEEYMDFLEVHPDEFAHLFNMILINVTAFFRDLPAWEFMSQEVVPRIIANRGSGEPIRIWSAGCASGEESYTLAMVFAEAMGFDRFRESVKIYATDVDEEALRQARQANYSARDIANIPPVMVERYLESNANGYTFHKDLRRSVIFGRHDLVKDAPISRIDLLVCRNTLMYFNAEVQTQVLNRFHFALNPAGYFFLGKAEMLFTHANLFIPFELKRRVFTRVQRGPVRERLFPGRPTTAETGTIAMTTQNRMRELSLHAVPIAQIIVDIHGTLVFANERARSLFRLSSRDVGRVLQDLELSYRPIELRSRVEQAYNERRTIDIKDVHWHNNNHEGLELDVQVSPLFEDNGTTLGVSVTFTDISRYKRLQLALEESNRQLETAYEELQSTNEELETTNEELQSTVEELETTNEELQSTNEELETMNEELQSTNEELQTINAELQTRSTELNDVNAYLNSILVSLRGGVIVVNRDLQIQIWNDKAVDLWGLRSEEVKGKFLLSLDIGLPEEELKAPLRACLLGTDSYQEVLVKATNRRGRAFLCRVSFTPIVSRTDGITGAIILMDESIGATDNHQ